VERFSSRREALGPVLSERLSGATRYLRIAGYFRSSLLEVVGEALETVGEIRVVCNGELDPHDVKVAKAARDGQEALARTLVSSWQATEDGLDLLLARERYRRLHDLLASGRMKVRVVPRDTDNVFVHGKAGVIEHGDGRSYAFVGSVNDSASGFRHAYEILWGDEDPTAADWVREEFDHFWRQGVDLPDAVVKHVAAMATRIEYRSIEEARDAEGGVPPDAILAERPIYKGGQILRPWQKRFVQSCVEDRRLHGKGRYLLADDVGLGKTLSMAAAALVLSLLDDKPVLILAPATLIWQWQEESGGQARRAVGGLVDPEEMLAKRRASPVDPEGRSDIGRALSLADRHHVHGADHQWRRCGRAGRFGAEVVRRCDPGRGAQGPRIPWAAGGAR
jgi:hypothetical protein